MCPLLPCFYIHVFLCSVFKVQFPTVKLDGGDNRDRTDDPLLAKQVLSQLSYTPKLSPEDPFTDPQN